MKKILLLSTLILTLASTSYAQDDIDMREPGNDYGMGNSIGFSILGDGLGMIYRHTFESENQLGGFLGYLPVTILNGTQRTFFNGFMLKPEYNFYIGSGEKRKEYKSGVKIKLKKRYVSLKQGFGFAGGTYNNDKANFWVSSTTLSFHQQRFLNNVTDKSVGFDIGVSYQFVGGTDVQITSSPISIYIRWDWAWFMH